MTREDILQSEEYLNQLREGLQECINQIREELEGYETKIKLFKVPPRYKENFEWDSKIFKRLKKESIFKTGFLGLGKIEDYDAEKINELNVTEIIALIRHFPGYASAAKPGDVSYQFRESLIEHLIKIAQALYIIDTDSAAAISVGGYRKDITGRRELFNKVVAELTLAKVLTGNIPLGYQNEIWVSEIAKNNLFTEIKEKYSQLENIDEFVNKAMDGELALGMPAGMMDLVFFEDSKWENSKESVKDNSTIIKAEFGYKGRNQRGNTKYEKEITFKNGFVTSWKDIN
jgi:hypothetical protein